MDELGFSDGFSFWLGKLAADLMMFGILCAGLIAAAFFKVFVWDEWRERKRRKR